jgi:signal transduction histidine kinase
LTLRGRLAWAFAAMLLIPVASVVLSAVVLRAWWGMADWPPEKIGRALTVLNHELLRDPSGLLGDGFDRVAAALPQGISLGVRVEDRWVRTTPHFDDIPGFGHRLTLLTWVFVPAGGKEASLEARLLPRTAFGNGWLLAPLGLLIVIITTLTVLTLMVGRSVIRPLRVLEAAARRLGDGDLEPGLLPVNPPEFGRVGAAFDELRRRLKEALLARQALEEERRTWVAAVSHDLRTPLAVVRGYAEGLRDGVASTPQKRDHYQEVILDRVGQLERLSDDLFQWARWDWGPPKLRFEPLDLAAELTAAARAWSDWPELEIEWTPPSGSWPIQADALALRRIFDNLARNVVHHTGPRPRLHVGLVRGYEVRFRDEGAGIPDDILPRVFERFFRGDPARNPSQGGGGLGLTIARLLAEAHGGSLEAANVDGGAEFTLRLPEREERA